MTPIKVGCPKCWKIVTAKRDRKTGRFVPRKHQCVQQPTSDAEQAPKTEMTITDDRIYSTEATGATPRQR